ncbi:MAG: hypothetical protein FJ009_07965 [Chloroflexi bacterium]|nr:hypothetical protein [Chloroflexota bacterium]
MKIKILRSALFFFWCAPILVAPLLTDASARPARAAGTISLTAAGTAYTENFDTLASSGTSSTVPTGWDFAESGTNANTLYTANRGASSTGDTYSYGADGSTERAFGGLQSGSVNPTIGASFTNNTGGAITALLIAYTGEQWRLGAIGRADRLDFQLSADATSLTTGTWNDYDALDFSSPVTSGATGALDGNAPANRTAISYAIGGLSIANGATFWIRWLDLNASGADDGLAIDDFHLTPNPAGVYLSINDVAILEGNSGTTLATFTVSLSAPAEAGGVTFDLATQDGTATTADNDYVARALTAQTIAEGSQAYIFQVTINGDTNIEPNETFYVNVTNVSGALLSDGQGVGTIQGDDPLRIHAIQGAAHISPYVGQAVVTTGIVTAVRYSGFYLQDPSPDADDATSEGIFVHTLSAPTVNLGDSILVNGIVTEFRPGSDAKNLTTTEITSPAILILSSGNALPAPIIVGTGGRIPPNTIINDDSTGDVETSGVFDPANDGIDFWESLEAMRVRLNFARAIGPTRYYATSNSYEIPVVGDHGANANVLTARGGIVIRANDFNPERIILGDALAALPTDLNVGDGFTGPIIGVIDYSYGNYKLYPIFALTRSDNGLTQETTTAQTGTQLAVATFNVENLDPNDSDGDTDVADGKFAGLANLIVNHLQSPDLLSIEEIQDNDGSAKSSVVSASATWTMLIDAITAAGGPTYQYRQIDPVDDQDGGQVGGNIRQGFLYRTDRGLAFVDRGAASATTANAVIDNGGIPQLQYSPGRIDPANAAFTDSRKPLAGEFTFNGQTLFVIANHWKSKGGDQPLFGRYQPPTWTTETQRTQQATVVGNFVQGIRAIDSNARVIVLGDLNDFEFSTPLSTLKTLGGLTNEIEFLPQHERYTYTYEGNSQALDHILVSPALAARRVRVNVVRVNAEFATRWSDHDSIVAVYDFTTYQYYLPIIFR